MIFVILSSAALAAHAGTQAHCTITSQYSNEDVRRQAERQGGREGWVAKGNQFERIECVERKRETKRSGAYLKNPQNMKISREKNRLSCCCFRCNTLREREKSKPGPRSNR